MAVIISSNNCKSSQTGASVVVHPIVALDDTRGDERVERARDELRRYYESDLGPGQSSPLVKAGGRLQVER